MEKILITGACGQLGSEIVSSIGEHSNYEVLPTDISDDIPAHFNRYEKLDVLDRSSILKLVENYKPTQIYHLAAVLSAKAESNPIQSWAINMDGLLNILEVVRETKTKKLFWPSSIAVFGSSTPRVMTPQDTVMDPNTVYGISKLAGERWCEYYFFKHGVDVRSVRYPGLIGYKSLPGGGTTDYAVDIFYKALQDEPFDCFLSEDSYLPMMYMEDAVRAIFELMEAPSNYVKVRSSYNLSAMSFSPREIAAEIRNFIPNLEVSYNPDYRQKIANTWPQSIDDRVARKDWGWSHKYGLPEMVKDILQNLRVTLES